MEDRSPQEYAYIMDGITTRMQLAIEKMSESNRMFRSTVRWVCLIMLIVVMVVVGGFIAETKIWIGHCDNLRTEVVASETVPQFTNGGGD